MTWIDCYSWYDTIRTKKIIFQNVSQYLTIIMYITQEDVSYISEIAHKKSEILSNDKPLKICAVVKDLLFYEIICLYTILFEVL